MKILNHKGLLSFIMVLLGVVGLMIVTTKIPKAPDIEPCTEAWYSYLSTHYADVTDGEGHGPDFGPEWLSGFERQLNLPINNKLNTPSHCLQIQKQLQQSIYFINTPFGFIISFKKVY